MFQAFALDTMRVWQKKGTKDNIQNLQRASWDLDLLKKKVYVQYLSISKNYLN